MAVPDEKLLRLEKSSSLIRNLVVIVGALISVVLFISGRLSSEIEVRVNGFNVGGNNLYAVPRDTLQILAGSNEDWTPVQQPDSLEVVLNRAVGRLDAIGEFTIRNRSSEPVDIELRLKHKSMYRDYNNRTKQSSHYTNTSFVFVYYTASTCTSVESALKHFEGCMIPPDSTKSLIVEKFPPDCTGVIQIAHLRNTDAVLEVYYNGKRAKLDFVSTVPGRIGSLASWIHSRWPLSAVVVILLPTCVLIWVTTMVLEALSRRRRVQVVQADGEEG